MTFRAYISPQTLNPILTLYRTTLRKMLFLRDYVAIDIIEALIPYPYKRIHHEAKDLFSRKNQLRADGTDDLNLLKAKVRLDIQELYTRRIPQSWVAACNALYYRNKNV